MSQEYPFGISASVRPLAQTVSGASGEKCEPGASCEISVDIPALNALAVRSLASLFREEEKLFSRCGTLTTGGFFLEKTSRRRTVVAVLGLQRLAESGGLYAFDLAAIRDAVAADRSWVRGLGDLGLLTWFTAEVVPQRLPGLFHEFDFNKALEAYPEGRQARTRGLALFLAGLSHARLTGAPELPDLTDIAADTYHLLVDNQGESGIFGQAGCPGTLQRAFCRRFGTFDDQMAAIYALSTFARAFHIEEPLAPALSCANSLRALQGEMGEWWFLYDKQACRVVNRYPVFSWHQDGTAPVGLFALEYATGQSFLGPICKGLTWITGLNELGNDLRSQEQGFIWDSIRHTGRVADYWEAALSLLSVSRRSQDHLRVRYEVRPDHFGWLLYAFGSRGLPTTAAGARSLENKLAK